MNTEFNTHHVTFYVPTKGQSLTAVMLCCWRGIHGPSEK